MLGFSPFRRVVDILNPKDESRGLGKEDDDVKATRTRVGARRKRDLANYFFNICHNVKNVRNSANFYVRNVSSALGKDPADRHPNEEEALAAALAAVDRKNDEIRGKFSLSVAAIGRALKWRQVTGSKAIAMVAAAAPFDVGEGARVAPEGASGSGWKRPKRLEAPTKERPFIGFEVIDSIFKLLKFEPYLSLPSQVAQKAVEKTVDSWLSYFKASKAYAKDPSAFTGKPRRPKYIRDDVATATFTNQSAKMTAAGGKSFLTFVKGGPTVQVYAGGGKYVRTEVVPRHGDYVLVVTTEGGPAEVALSEGATRFLGIDPDVTNFVAVANNVGAAPFIVKGGPIKAINQWYAKRKAKIVSSIAAGKDPATAKVRAKSLDALSREREAKLDDLFYKIAHFICRFCVAHDVQAIVFAHNRGQKNGIGLGDATNQAFVSIPFARFSEILRRTAWKHGIAYVEREESYTSKSSFLDMDPIPTYVKGVKPDVVFSGYRPKRGLYVSKDGTRLNADVNGALNLIRKEFPRAFDGVDLKYTHETTNVVKFEDLYPAGDQAKKTARRAAGKPRAKKPGPSSATRRRERRDRKHELMAAFDAGRKPYDASKTKGISGHTE